MRPFRDISIRRKLIVMGLIASSAALLLACSAFLGYGLFAYRETMIHILSVRASIIGTHIASAIVFKDERAAADTLASLKEDPHIISAGVYTPDNLVFAMFGQNETNREAPFVQRFSGNPEGYWFERDSLILYRKIVFKGEHIGTVYIHSDLQEMYPRFWQYIGITLLVFFVSSIVALIVSSLFERKITHPLFHLVETVRTISAEKDYSVRAVTNSKDETGILVEAFNDMLTQIQRQSVALQLSSDEVEQRVIQRTRELESANKELETFSYSVSHDLRTPLRGIDGFCEALVEDYADKLDEQGKDYLRRIQAAAVRMGQLVDDLLDLSKVNRMQLLRSDIDLTALVQGLSQELQERDPDRQAEFHIQTGLVANADAQWIGIVLTNLLENAWKFTSKQKRPRIEFGAVKTTTETAYFVRDNGAGFDMAYVNKLFAPFQRLHTATQYPGTGIGLATVQRIILRHGGRVWAEGEIEKGASLYFTLAQTQSVEDTGMYSRVR
ncbi:MAG TPA: ATP-binding protein [Nitrospirales bacterium]